MLARRTPSQGLKRLTIRRWRRCCLRRLVADRLPTDRPVEVPIRSAGPTTSWRVRERAIAHQRGRQVGSGGQGHRQRRNLACSPGAYSPGVHRRPCGRLATPCQISPCHPEFSHPGHTKLSGYRAFTDRPKCNEPAVTFPSGFHVAGSDRPSRWGHRDDRSVCYPRIESIRWLPTCSSSSRAPT